MIPAKDGESTLGGLGKDSGAGDSRNRRRLREEPEASVAAEGGGEGISTASVALKAERYRPRIYGFQLNETAKLQRWQEAVRDRYDLLHSCLHSLINGFTAKSRDWNPWRRKHHRCCDCFSVHILCLFFLQRFSSGRAFDCPTKISASGSMLNPR